MESFTLQIKLYQRCRLLIIFNNQNLIRHGMNDPRFVGVYLIFYHKSSGDFLLFALTIAIIGICGW
jgi:hypothetical protein